MQIQKSFDIDKGGLYVVPTPIGNLEDITFRALKILKNADVIAAEDTRNTQKLLNHFQIKTPLVSYHEHNKNMREGQLIEQLQDEKTIALVSDAGMPAVSDPGYEIVKKVIQKNLPVIVLPGANAALCALVGSGLRTDEFLFYGFLPRKRKEKEEQLNRLKNLQATLIFYESPYRLKETMKTIYEQLGNRHIAIARELTKRFEEYIRGPIKEIIDWSENNDFKGECCIIVEGGQDQKAETALWWSHLNVKDHVTHYMKEEQVSSKEAIKQVAQERNMRRRDVYEQYHIL